VGAPGLYRTSDGGQTWTQTSCEPATKLEFRDASLGYAVPEMGDFVLITQDGGLTWRRAPLPTGAVCLAPTEHGFLFGGGFGAILAARELPAHPGVRRP
jgi:photosystem II stability/assembly factor-like uncharacterized protein